MVLHDKAGGGRVFTIVNAMLRQGELPEDEEERLYQVFQGRARLFDISVQGGGSMELVARDPSSMGIACDVVWDAWVLTQRPNTFETATGYYCNT